MGCIYSVGLDIKLREDRGGRKSVAKSMHRWMIAMSKPIENEPLSNVRWSFAESRKSGIRPDSVAGICKILLAFYQGDGLYSKKKDGFERFSSCFKATYSWGSILELAFRRLAWFLDTGSTLEIDCDEGRDMYRVEVDHNGEGLVWEMHRRH